MLIYNCYSTDNYLIFLCIALALALALVPPLTTHRPRGPSIGQLVSHVVIVVATFL